MIEIEHWLDEWGDLTEQSLRSRLESEGYSVNRYAYPPGTYFPDHRHNVDKKDAVLRGRFLLRAEGREFLLGPGDALCIPAGTVHSAEVIGGETVISLDATRE
jgi:quercetin dioxygenase-like cupin family protein